jgi:hypothetical protein
MAAGQKAVNRFAGKPVGKVVLNPLLAGIKLMYRMQSLELIPMGDKWGVKGVVNPEATAVTDAKVDGADVKPDVGVNQKFTAKLRGMLYDAIVVEIDNQNKLVYYRYDARPGMEANIPVGKIGTRIELFNEKYRAGAEFRPYQMLDMPVPLRTRVSLRSATKAAVRGQTERVMGVNSDTGKTEMMYRSANPPGKLIPPGREHFGHKPVHKWSIYQSKPENQTKTRAEVVEDQNKAEIYRIELDTENLSGEFE